jgi:type IV pilus assembly protein PilY1
MKKFLRYAMRLEWIVCLSIGFPGSAKALLPFSNAPFFMDGNISPNVMFTLDDSGSMQDEILPDDSSYSRFLFPRADHVYSTGMDNSNDVPTFADGFSYSARMRSSQTNPIYYNPAVTYRPWSNADGSLMANADPVHAFHNSVKTGAGSRDLTVDNTQWAEWDSCNDADFVTCGDSLSSQTFYPAVYFYFKGGDEWNWSNYIKQEIRSTIPVYTDHGRENRKDCTNGVCTYVQEIGNFANWYTYHRSRILVARAGVGQAFAAQGNTMRVGFASINAIPVTVDGLLSDGAVINGVRQFIDINKTHFFDSLYGHEMPASGTPLRSAVNNVGRYFQRSDDNGPWGEIPGTGGGTQQACRQSFNILMTDGYWNDGTPPAGINNSDNMPGISMINHSSPAIPPTYVYVPVLPYADSWSNTLADAAMFYWKNDLRPDLPNKVPANSNDPAFWQHMVTFTVGLGVSGTLMKLPSDLNGLAWPDPSSSQSAKIDDLWHAAVNSRGHFYSATDPVAFADALASVLSTIAVRTGSASAVAVNSNSSIANGRIYQAKFSSGDWAGQLLSIPIDTAGTFGAVEWNAGDISLKSGTINPADRIIITKGSSGGVPFEYANLTVAQKGLLDKDVAGTVDHCGLERVAYLRGSAVHEGSGTFSCASTSVINKFRGRPASKLGDIVNSGPYYAGRPNAGYSNEDQAGYSAFRTLYKYRTPVVYVGANDGMLHGFNACIDGITPGCTVADKGKELVAYIPGLVYANLNRLGDENYNASHRYFVDGSPMVADVYAGITPKWKSILVGGLNGGGQGYYALDITDPTHFTAAKASELLLWEFTNADDADMGYSYNLPSVNSVTGQSGQIVKMANDKWAVVLGNGYNSSGGKAVLYVLFITSGEDGVWTIGTDYIKLVADAGTGNGLSTPMPFDSNGDGLMDVIYAGDIKGNLWKFDVVDAVPANWKVALMGAPLFVSGVNQPIISPPVVTFHPKGGQMVMFGTGKYLELGDIATTNTQAMYGIWDDNSTAPVTMTNLVQQVMTNAAVRVVTQHPVLYTFMTKGWYFGLPVAGERLAGVPVLENGVFVFTTIVPSASPCDFGGRGFVNAVDFLMGGMLTIPTFDHNRDGIVDQHDDKSAGMEIGFAAGGTTRIRGVMDDALISSAADGSLARTPVSKGTGLRGRITWKELMH